MSSKKVILAFSGGLDTSFSVPYLMDQGYEVVTVTVDTGGYSQKELSIIAKKSKWLGAIKHYLVDGKASMYDEVVSYIIKTNGLYQGSYPNMCADRYVIVNEIIKVAAKENCSVVAHGSTAMGNDQVRFDIALMMLAPQISIVSPIKEMGGNRIEEQLYLKNKGFDVALIHKKYSINQNILGVTYSGGEIDQIQEPNESMFIWTQKKIEKDNKYLKLTFKDGLPIAINDKKTIGSTILQELNQVLGKYGYGKKYYTGDCMIGIKGHIVFEAPGILALIEAHHSLEQLVLTKHQQTVGEIMSHHFTDLLYMGKLYDPAVSDIKAFVDSQQKVVTGEVTLKLEAQQVYPVAITSPYSLIHPDIASYAQKCSWSVSDADGFIKLFGMQGKIASLVNTKIEKKGEHNNEL